MYTEIVRFELMHLGFVLNFALDFSDLNLLHTDLSDADLDSLRYRYGLFLCKHVFDLQDVLKTLEILKTS